MTDPSPAARAPDEPLQPAESSGLLATAIARAKEGDIGALHFIYVRYADDVYDFVNSIVRDHLAAEHVTQNVFAKLTQVIGKYEKPEVPFGTWILRVARNAALDHLRARRHEPIGFERFQMPA
jgi:RNA polymerase sigma-70 factor, ECF subfamily